MLVSLWPLRTLDTSLISFQVALHQAPTKVYNFPQQMIKFFLNTAGRFWCHYLGDELLSAGKSGHCILYTSFNSVTGFISFTKFTSFVMFHTRQSTPTPQDVLVCFNYQYQSVKESPFCLHELLIRWKTRSRPPPVSTPWTRSSIWTPTLLENFPSPLCHPLNATGFCHGLISWIFKTRNP